MELTKVQFFAPARNGGHTAELAPARLAELAKNYGDHDEARDLAEQAAM